MQFQFDVAPQTAAAPPAPAGTDSTADLLRQMLDLQRDHLGQIAQSQRDLLAQARSQALDNSARWRNLLARWRSDLPELPDHCRQAYPVLERAYVQMVSAMTRELSEQADDALDSEFAIQDFLDRYGVRLGQLGHMLNIVGTLAEAAHQNEAATQE